MPPSYACASCLASPTPIDRACARCGGPALAAGRYALLARSARGAVWRARRVDGGADVALRRAPIEALPGPGAWDEFEERARRLAAVDHPAMARYVEHFADPTGRGALYLATEWIDGPTLAEERAHDAAPAIERVLSDAREIALLIAHLHALVPPLALGELASERAARRPGSTVVLLGFGAGAGMAGPGDEARDCASLIEWAAELGARGSGESAAIARALAELTRTEAGGGAALAVTLDRLLRRARHAGADPGAIAVRARDESLARDESRGMRTTIAALAITSVATLPCAALLFGVAGALGFGLIVAASLLLFYVQARPDGPRPPRS